MILIRTDANEYIGTGHVMRCLSIADAFVSLNEKVSFITADHKGDKLIKERGYQTICLNTNWRKMDSEIEILSDIIDEKQPSLMFVDSYYVTRDFFDKLSGKTKIAYIDDLNTQVWNIDYLINYNIFSNEMDYSRYFKTDTCLLLGPMYAPLRNEFTSIPSHPISDHVAEILVSAGGADPEMITELLIAHVCPKWRDIKFHFIVGAMNPRIEEIKKLERDNIVLHISEAHMAELMLKCDMAISAAGTTLYELCACGIPTITYILADNQILAAEQFKKRGIMLNAGDSRMDGRFAEKVSELMEILVNSKDTRLALATKMQELVNGDGAFRIARKLVNR